jgi:hypothetical protein
VTEVVRARLAEARSPHRRRLARGRAHQRARHAADLVLRGTAAQLLPPLLDGV